MKLFLEADFAKGNGAIRWEGVALRRLKRYALCAIGLAGTFMLLLSKYAK